MSLLPDILSAYQFAILDIVLDRELRRHPQTCTQLNNHIRILKNIEVIGWNPNYEMIYEYNMLIKTLGVGESASMVYCKYHPNVLASSNLRDIKSYCEQNRITYLSTMDLLYLACHRKVMTEQACDRFIADVLRQGSKLPVSKLYASCGSFFFITLFCSLSFHSFPLLLRLSVRPGRAVVSLLCDYRQGV